MTDKENTLLTTKHVLICADPMAHPDLELIKTNFCGIVLGAPHDHKCSFDTLVYMGGDIEKIHTTDGTPLVIKELSYNYTNKHQLVSIGEVPLNIHNVGVYFRNFFSSTKDYFGIISKEHEFQSLTESTKGSSAFRKGIYLTEVTKADDDALNFNLLRCSTNMNGPTDNFRTTDHEVVAKVNDICKYFFSEKTNLNHVLAQIYHNGQDNSQKKAKIKEHSDKTKDMPRAGLIAFCTFYNGDDLKGIKEDYCYNKTSVLTKLRFRLKDMVKDEKYVKQFDVVLYPNSVFIIPLSTNRLYTHEIVPSVLPVDKIPTRLGYVIRCSETRAVSKNGQVYITEDGGLVKLEKPTNADVDELRKLYFKENTTDELMDYGKVNFSMNDGDYVTPKL
jgi:hypothetical protein